MDKPTIQTAVWHAADQLFAAGVRPTVANIREITKRGSAGTINEALKEWWRDLSARVRTQNHRPDVPEPVAHAMSQLWATSLDRAEHSLLVHKEDADRQVKEAHALQLSADQSREESERRCRALEEELAQIRLSSAEVQRALAAETALRNESLSRIKSIREEAANAIAGMHASLVRMEKQSELEKEHYQEMQRNLTAQADESKLMRQQAEKRLADLQVDAARMEQSYRSELFDHKERCARQLERCALLEQRISALELELNQATEKMHGLISENTMLSSLSPRAIVGAGITPRLRTSRAKKRRF
jgi:hypothetical protein